MTTHPDAQTNLATQGDPLLARRSEVMEGWTDARLRQAAHGGRHGLFRYRAYGEIAQSWGASTTPALLGYAGQFLDPSGLYYLRARWYDPASARFMSRDPLAGASVGTPRSLNAFAYGHTNPITMFDPSGLSAVSEGQGTCRRRDGCGAGGVGGLPDLVSGLLDTATKVQGFVSEALTPAAPSLFVDLVGGQDEGKRLMATHAWMIVAGNVPVGIAPKVSKQLAPRGWTENSVNAVVGQPSRTVPTHDTRWTRAGTRMSDPATAYFDNTGNYVVVNDRTNEVVQISNRNDPTWRWTPR